MKHQPKEAIIHNFVLYFKAPIAIIQMRTGMAQHLAKKEQIDTARLLKNIKMARESIARANDTIDTYIETGDFSHDRK